MQFYELLTREIDVHRSAIPIVLYSREIYAIMYSQHYTDKFLRSEMLMMIIICDSNIHSSPATENQTSCCNIERTWGTLTDHTEVRKRN